MAVEFVRVNATDTLQRGARYRLTYQKYRIVGVVAPSMQTVWERLASLEPGAIPISPAPADGPVAVIDVKVPVSAPSMSVGQYAGTLNHFTAIDLTRVEAIDSKSLSATVASQERTAVQSDAVKARAASSPLNIAGNILGGFAGTLKLLAVAAIVVGGVVLYVKYGPKRKRGR